MELPPLSTVPAAPGGEGIVWRVPPLPPACVLVYTAGMPFYGKSDGLESPQDYPQSKTLNRKDLQDLEEM